MAVVNTWCAERCEIDVDPLRRMFFHPDIALVIRAVRLLGAYKQRHGIPLIANVLEVSREII